MICGNAKCIVGCGVFCMKKKLVLTMFVISVSSVLFACSFSDSVITSENAGSEILLAEENGFVDDTSKEEESANGQETKDKKDNTDLNDKNNNDTNITDKDSKEDKNKDENSKDNKADKDTNKENNKDNKKDNNKDENKDDKNKADKNGEVDDSDLKVASKEQAEKEAAEKTDTEKTDTEQENKEQVILAETDQTAAEIEAVLEAIDGVIVPANNGKVLAINNGKIEARSVQWGGGSAVVGHYQGEGGLQQLGRADLQHRVGLRHHEFAHLHAVDLHGSRLVGGEIHPHQSAIGGVLQQGVSDSLGQPRKSGQNKAQKEEKEGLFEDISHKNNSVYKSVQK